MFTSDYTDKFLAAIENLGLTTEQLFQADKDKSCEKLNKILNKLDKASLVNFTSQLAVYSYKSMIEADKKIDNVTAMFEGIVETVHVAHEYLNDTAKRKKSAKAKKAANVKASKQSTEKGKPAIKQKWLEWKEKPHQYESNNDFATQIIKDKADYADAKTIKDTWIKEWAQEAIKQVWDDWQKSVNPQTLYASDDAFANAMFTKYHETKGNRNLTSRSDDLKVKIKEDCVTWRAELLQK